MYNIYILLLLKLPWGKTIRTHGRTVHEHRSRRVFLISKQLWHMINVNRAVDVRLLGPQLMLMPMGIYVYGYALLYEWLLLLVAVVWREVYVQLLSSIFKNGLEKKSKKSTCMCVDTSRNHTINILFSHATDDHQVSTMYHTQDDKTRIIYSVIEIFVAIPIFSYKY